MVDADPPICHHCKQYGFECTFFLPITETRFKKKRLEEEAAAAAAAAAVQAEKEKAERDRERESSAQRSPMPDSVRNVRVDGMYAFCSVIVCVFPLLCRFHILFLLPPLLFLFPFRGPGLFCLFFFRYAHVGHVDLCHDSTMFTCHIVYYFRAFFYTSVQTFFYLLLSPFPPEPIIWVYG